MKRIATLALILLAPLVAGCAVIDRFDFGSANQAAVDQPGQIEPVHAVAVARDQAVFRVSSNGCTAKADLTPVVRRAGDASVISLRRVREDRCGSPRPEGVELRWTFEEMGLAPGARVSIENPYQLPPA